MKTRPFSATAMVCATALMITTIVSNAGPLSPPAGPVTSTSKTLGDVEPRIAVNSTNTPGDAFTLFKITQPGSYILTGNVTGAAFKDGIQIAASGVTLDLMGFDVQGVAVSSDGILVTAGVSNVHIRNGSVRDWGNDGVNAGSASNSSLLDLLSHNNGNQGFRIGAASVVRNCNAQSNGGTGIFASDTSIVEGCTVRSNGAGLPGSFGIKTSTGSMVIDCAVLTQTGDGISAGIGNTVRGCVVATSSGTGIVASTNSTISDCTVKSNTGNGIRAFGGCTVRDNNASSNDNGIEFSSECRILNNHCDSNTTGLLTVGDSSHIDGNSSTGNGFSMNIGGSFNVIIRNAYNSVTTGTPTNYWGQTENLSIAGYVSTDHPWANFFH